LEFFAGVFSHKNFDGWRLSRISELGRKEGRILPGPPGV